MYPLENSSHIIGAKLKEDIGNWFCTFLLLIVITFWLNSPVFLSHLFWFNFLALGEI